MLAKAAGIAAPARAKHAQQLDGTIIWGAEVVHARRAWRREAGGRGGAGRGMEPPGALGHHAADGDDGVLEDGRFSVLGQFISAAVVCTWLPQQEMRLTAV